MWEAFEMERNLEIYKISFSLCNRFSIFDPDFGFQLV